MKTFVIGDVHGHADRLQTLLDAAGITMFKQGPMIQRPNGTYEEVEIVQLGDLGNFGKRPRGDLEAYQLALKYRMVVLWGNHDRAVVDWNKHIFKGYTFPPPVLEAAMRAVHPRLAHHAHGYLLTHAGLHPYYVDLLGMRGLTAENMAAIIMAKKDKYPDHYGVVDDIGPVRGGFAKQGGILWRDVREELASIPQVFGHSSGSSIRTCLPDMRNARHSWCIDVGGHTDGRLAGIWLPTEELVVVGPDADFIRDVVEEM